MKFLTLSVIVPALLGLSACTTTNIKSNSPSVAIAGTLKTGLQEHRAELVYNGKTYRGVWRELAATSEQMAQVAYPHRKHLERISVELTANDGSALQCSGLTHAMWGELTCNADERVLTVTLN